MRILEKWPTLPRKLTQVQKAEPYLDGRIYEFDADDCFELFGLTIVSDYEHNSDEENARHTVYLRSQSLHTLEAILKAGVRALHGPYQSRFKYTNNTVIFQFTGLRVCRFKTCKTLAVHNAKGYCNVHYTMKKKAGKV